MKLDIQKKNNLFVHYNRKLLDLHNRQFRLSFRVGNTKFFVFSFEKIEIHGDQFILTEVVTFNHRESHHLYKNRYYVANKCEILESNYHV